MQWHGPLCLSKRAELDTVVIGDVEFTSGIWNEKRILIEALEKWLENWNREFGYFDRQASKKRMP